VIAEPPRTGNSIGVLFLPCGQGLAEERIGDCSLLFYVISGKMLVNMALEDGLGGKTARFSVNQGGACEVPCRTTYSLRNELPTTTTQLVFWRWRAEDGSRSDHIAASCGASAARQE
jgi:mannose-6-phosphate isomerase-like protein (cupin superfamily)